MWKRFGFEPYQEACAARLLPGDGIARRVMVQMFDELDGRAAPKKKCRPPKTLWNASSGWSCRLWIAVASQPETRVTTCMPAGGLRLLPTRNAMSANAQLTRGRLYRPSR